jgi:sulfopyruvate decarboxylase TPP-binding subunit
MEHTKGGWGVNDGLVSAKQSNGLLKTICSVNGYTKKEYEANASLIAAAPELLNALEELVYQLTGEQECEEEIEKAFGITMAMKINMAKAAIKKAKGEN